MYSVSEAVPDSHWMNVVLKYLFKTAKELYVSSAGVLASPCFQEARPAYVRHHQWQAAGDSGG